MFEKIKIEKALEELYSGKSSIRKRSVDAQRLIEEFRKLKPNEVLKVQKTAWKLTAPPVTILRQVFTNYIIDSRTNNEYFYMQVRGPKSKPILEGFKK